MNTKSKWTKELCREESLKYDGRYNFKNGSNRAYEISRINKWLNDICSHMKEKIKPPNYWTKEKCQEEALKYNTRIDFCNKSNSAYIKSLRSGYSNEICQHMLRIGNNKKRCIYSYEFHDNHVYIGLTFNLLERDISRKLKKTDQVTKYIKITNQIPIIKQLTEYVDVKLASELESKYIEIYREKGWVILNIAKGGCIGGNKLKWTKDKCHEEALKCKTRTEFKKNSDSAYKSAKKHAWFDDICNHMQLKFKKWSVELCQEEALKHSSRYEFSLNNLAAYTWAIRHNILNEICSHMKKKK